MTPARIEDKSQEEIMWRLKAAIDAAINTPSIGATNAAVDIATQYPRALAGGKLRANLGKQRWDWLNEHGVTTTFGVIEPDFKS